MYGLEVVADGGASSSNAPAPAPVDDQHVVALVDARHDVGDLRLMLSGVMPCAALYSRCFSRRRLVSAIARSIEPVIAVGIEDRPAVDVARGAADGLDQRGLGAQEAFLVGVEDRDQPAFGDVEALAQQVDADQHVEDAEPQVADDLDPLQRLDVGVHVADADALLVQVFGEVLGHALGQRGDERAIAALRHLPHLADEVVDLVLDRPDLDRRVDQAGRADHLLDEHAARRSSSQPPGVAETALVCGRIASHSLKRSGRLSMQDGRRKPYSASVALRRKSPRYMPPICGTVTWLSSTNSSALSGRYSNRVGGGSPGRRPVR